MSQPPGATRLISPIFLGKQSPGKEIGLAGIRYSIFCRVLRQAIPALFNQLHGASSQNAEYVYFDLMQEEYAQNQKYFTGEQRRDTRDFPPLSGTRGARCRGSAGRKKKEARRLLPVSGYCGVVPSAMRFAWRRSRCSCAHAFCCSGVITAHTCLRVSILICFSFC